MGSLNRVMLMGNLTRDPVVRSIPSGTPVAEFGLAINESYKGRDGNKQDKTCFVDVVVWDRQATACAEHLRKGSPVFIEGKLQLDEWTDKTSGDKRSRLRVRADRVHFMGNGGNGGHRDETSQEDELDDLPAPPPDRPRPKPANAPQPAPVRAGR